MDSNGSGKVTTKLMTNNANYSRKKTTTIGSTSESGNHGLDRKKNSWLKTHTNLI